jgi:hypothetical protein
MADLDRSRETANANVSESIPRLEIPAERRLSRSPHPYHRRGTSLLSSPIEGDFDEGRGKQKNDSVTPKSSSDSGTEADDERGRFLKGLPAPPLRPHKGLRDAPFSEPTPQPSPLGTPPVLEAYDKRLSLDSIDQGRARVVDRSPEVLSAREKYTKRKRAEVVRRTTEAVLFFVVASIVSYNQFLEGESTEFEAGEHCLNGVALISYTP